MVMHHHGKGSKAYWPLRAVKDPRFPQFAIRKSAPPRPAGAAAPRAVPDLACRLREAGPALHDEAINPRR